MNNSDYWKDPKYRREILTRPTSLRKHSFIDFLVTIPLRLIDEGFIMNDIYDPKLKLKDKKLNISIVLDKYKSINSVPWKWYYLVLIHEVNSSRIIKIPNYNYLLSTGRRPLLLTKNNHVTRKIMINNIVAFSKKDYLSTELYNNFPKFIEMICNRSKDLCLSRYYIPDVLYLLNLKLSISKELGMLPE